MKKQISRSEGRGLITISRTSMYTYYYSKEAVFVDLMIYEYDKLRQEFDKAFGSKMSREDFCMTLSGILWNHLVLLKLLSLQLSVWDHRCDDSLVKRFVAETQPYMRMLDNVLRTQFHDADTAVLNRFKLQFSVYCNSLYTVVSLPKRQRDTMLEYSFFEAIPTREQICYEGLMLLSAELP